MLQPLPDAEAAVDAVISRVGKKIVLALPLGLGKPLRFANAIYRRAQRDQSLNLHIVTGLSLQAPEGSSSLERRFLKPFLHRLYGEIPILEYARDAAKGKLPENVTVSEFFFQAGIFLNQQVQQRHFVYANYTHVVRDLLAAGVNVVAQMVATDPGDTGNEKFSLSCNPDLTLDLLPLMRQRETPGSPIALVAETNSELPYLGNDALIPKEAFDIILSQPATDYPLFPVPQTSVSSQEHLIGFYASTLLRDGGTLQVGIGALGSAVVHSTILRHCNNTEWNRLYQRLGVAEKFPVVTEVGGTDRFEKGLYGCSEMMTEGFLHLMNAEILTRRVSGEVVMHGGFYLGSNALYQQLRELDAVQRDRICMTSVNYINDLFDHPFGDQQQKVSERVHGRFINSAMMQTLSGETVSDALDDGRVISGVGGQYNFVAMAHELPEARSIMILRSFRYEKGVPVSNILFNYGRCTIPGHLRDIVITEYGIADLRGRQAEEVCLQLIRIADARFQPGLLEQAKKAGKVAGDFVLPDSWQQNTPQGIADLLADGEFGCLFPAFPFGNDFTDDELVLSKALTHLKSETATTTRKVTTVLKALLTGNDGEKYASCLSRMSLAQPASMQEWLERRLVIWALQVTSG